MSAIEVEILDDRYVISDTSTNTNQGHPEELEKSYALSFAQQRLWFLSQMYPDIPLYNITLPLQLEGNLNVGALQRAFEEIIRRHESLRTSFRVVDGQPIQVVSQKMDFALSVQEIQEPNFDTRQKIAEEIAYSESKHLFNLGKEPLFRVSLIRIHESNHLLILNMHHIICDGWSVVNLFREMSTLYASFCNGESFTLPPIETHYRDYARWQRDWLQGETLQKEINYWKEQLRNLPVIKLPTDHPRPAIQDYSGSTQSFELPESLHQALLVFSQQNRSTLYMTILAVVNVLLFRYSAQEDFAIGSAFAGRTKTEQENLIGFFVNTLVLRSRLSGNQTFRQVLMRVRETALDAFAHQDLPFEKLIEQLQPQRLLNQTPLFQVMFDFQKDSVDSLVLSGLKISCLEIRNRTSKFDLTFFIREGRSSLKGRLEYSTALFENSTIQRMMGHLETLLHGIVENADRPISSLPLLTATERQRILVEWNDTKSDYPRNATVHELFERQAELQPDAIALRFGTEQITYTELNRRSNRFAHLLRENGVEPDTIVGVFLERSVEMIVSLLAILKAGGCYLPLDATYPEERLQFMLQDAKVSLIVTQNRLKEKIGVCAASLLFIDDATAEKYEEANPTGRGTAKNLCYVMYTSGSTGKPKAVCIPHRAVIRLVCNINYVSISSNDRMGQVSSSSFDAFTFEVWGALLNGASVVGVTKDVAISPKPFVQQIRNDGITIMFLTTPLFNLIVSELPDAFRSMDQLLVGGDALDAHFIRRVLKAGRPRRLLNGYGPTETTTFASFFEVKDLSENNTTVPIGRPISNTQIYILDAQLQPVPVGVPGEIYIAGDGLARGYLNRDELNVEKFIHNPFVPEPDSRMYRTGDFGRYSTDGSIDFLGRIDHQVKIRGFRVELEEIESVLCESPTIEQAVVRYQGESDKKLIAYVVPAKSANPSLMELRKFLQNRLPDYMIPSHIQVLEKFPLNPVGKIDHSLLTDPQLAVAEITEPNERTPDAVEEQLLKVWKDVLSVKTVKLTENFFDLGGHSLLAVRLLSEIEKATGEHFPLAALFQAPTIEQMSRMLRQKVSSLRWRSIIPLQEKGSKRPFYCAPGPPGTPLGFRQLARLVGEDQPFFGLQCRGVDGKESICSSVEEIAEYFLHEIRAFQPEGPYYFGGSSMGGLIAFEMSRQLELKGEKVGLLALFDTGAPVHRHQNALWTRLRTDFHAIKILRRGRIKRYFARRIKTIYGDLIGKPYLSPKAALLPPQLVKVHIINVKAAKKYRPGSYRGNITLFRSTKNWQQRFEPYLGWNHLTSGEIKVVDVSGPHDMAHNPESVKILAEVLRQSLDEAQSLT